MGQKGGTAARNEARSWKGDGEKSHEGKRKGKGVWRKERGEGRLACMQLGRLIYQTCRAEKIEGRGRGKGFPMSISPSVLCVF